MTQLEEAVARFTKIIDAPAYQDLAWASDIQSQFSAKGLMTGGRPVCPVLRPHFVSKRQQELAVKVTSTLYTALGRLQEMALANPQILSRLESIPAEKMLAQVNPGYPELTAAAFATLQIHNGSMSIEAYSNEGPTDALLTDALAEIFWDSGPMKDLRKKQKFAKPVKSTKLIIDAIFAAYKGKQKRGAGLNGLKKFPRIAIVEPSQGVRSAPAAESQFLAEQLRQLGYPTEVVNPEQLDYRNNQLCRGDFGIEIVYRRISAQELLVRFDLNHPLLRAYRDGTVKVINSFRSDMLSKPAVLTLLSDDEVTAKFPAAERKILAAHVPWTRMVAPGKTTIAGKKGPETVETLEYVLNHREQLVLRPNDALSDAQTYRGWETEQSTWDRALRTALRTPYVVQQRTPEARAPFPVMQFGKLEMRDMRVATEMHTFGANVQGASASLTDATTAFSLLNGTAPVFVMD